MSDLVEEIACLKKCMHIATGFVDIRKCQSCKNPYASGYVCSCGRDNSFTNEEWAKKAEGE